MAEKNTQTLDNLNQNNLGDKKLSREEIAYIQSKDQLWFKDIGEKLFDDIVSTNEKLLKDNTALKAFIDDIILQPETLRQIAQKAGISLGKVEKMFSEGNQNLDNKTSKYYVVINLLLYGCTKNIFPEVRGNLIDNIYKPAFTGATAKALHKFQKMGEQTQGRSKADCLLGPKTLQQMLSYLGVQTVNQKVDSETFARSNMSAKETYEWNAQQQKQMDIIINDPALTPEQKVSFLAQVANKTVDVGSDKLNKKYGAVSYMCQLIANNLMVGTTPEQQENILAAVLPYEKLIKKYWNEKSAVEYGVDPKLVPKTNDFVKDIKDMAKAVEAKYQSNTIMTQTALQICGAWISYYQQDNPTGRKKHQTSIEQGKKELESLLMHKTTGDIRQNIVSAMDKIFFDTAQNFDFSTVVTDTVIVGGVDIAGSFTSFENLQKRAFKGVKNIFLSNRERNAKESKNAINEILTAFRYIDKEMDGDFDIGLGEKFRVGTWKTSDGIKSTVENMGMSGLVIDVNNAPQGFDNESKEFTNEQSVIKNGIQHIKEALEKDPNGTISKKVDKLLVAIAVNDTTTIKSLIKDAELFGLDISDNSIGEITKRMQEISKENEKNKTTILHDIKKNYTKIYEQMNGTVLWLRGQGRSKEADMIEGNKQVFEVFINGGIVSNPPIGFEQFAGKSLDSIATEEIHKMERSQLAGVLEVGLVRNLMRKHERLLENIAKKTGLSADENLIKLYADIDGIDGSWKDETCNAVGAIVAEILITIAVSILTAGVGGVLLQAGLKAAQFAFKAVRWGTLANKIARFGQLGNTTLKAIRTAQGVSKTVKAGQIATKIAFRSTALLAEAPLFNSVSKIIHNGLEGKGFAGGELFEGINLNPLAKDNIQTAAFLGVMHGFSVLKSGAVKIDFGKAGKIFAKSPEFIKSAGSMTAEFTTMMASEQVMNLTFGREIPDPENSGKTKIERGIHIPDKKEIAQMVGMILGMRASAKYNIWPKIEQKFKLGEFTILGAKKGDIILADKLGNKMSVMDIMNGKIDGFESGKNNKKESIQSVDQIKSNIETWVNTYGRGRTVSEFKQILDNLSSKSSRVRKLAEAELSQIDSKQIKVIQELYSKLDKAEAALNKKNKKDDKIKEKEVKSDIKNLDGVINKVKNKSIESSKPEYESIFNEWKTPAEAALQKISEYNKKIIEVENSNVSANIIETKKNQLLSLIEKEVNIIYSADVIDALNKIRTELKKKGLKGLELEKELEVYENEKSTIYRNCKEIITQYRNEQELPIGKYVYDRFKHRERHTINTPQGSIQFENIGKNVWMVHAGISSKILAGKAYNYLYDKLPVGAKIIEQKSLSGDSFTNLLKLYKKGGDVDCAVSHEGFVSLNFEGENTGVSTLVRNRMKEQKSVKNAQGQFVTSQEVAQEIVTQINRELEGTDLPKAYAELFEGYTDSYLVKLPNIVLTKLEGNLPGIIHTIENVKSYNEIYQKLDVKLGETIKFSDIKLTGQQLKDRIKQYQEGKLDITFIPKEIRSYISTIHESYKHKDYNILSGDFTNEGGILTRTKIDSEIVVKNMQLTEIERISTAETLLSKQLTQNQRDAILKAHVVGKKRGAEIYNYTVSEILQKARILKDAGFSSLERRTLLENGICGEVGLDVVKYNIDNLEKNITNIIAQKDKLLKMNPRPSNFDEIMNQITLKESTIQKQVDILKVKYKDLESQLTSDIKEIPGVAKVLYLNKIRKGESVDYNEDVYFVNKDIAVISDGVSDSDFAKYSKLLVDYVVSHKDKLTGQKEDLLNIINDFIENNISLYERQNANMSNMATLALVKYNGDGTKTIYVVGDSSVFIDGKEYTNIGQINVIPDQKVANKSNLRKMQVITTTSDNIILATDEIANVVRMNPNLTIDNIEKSRPLYQNREGNKDDITLIDLRK